MNWGQQWPKQLLKTLVFFRQRKSNFQKKKVILKKIFGKYQMYSIPINKML